jgi:imidazole glycerol-phosphate synthase subunit HisH
MIAVIDIGIGNVGSITNALRCLKYSYSIVNDAEKLALCDKIIFPGVGSFRSGSEKLFSTGMVETIVARVRSGVPILGICLGMQLLSGRGFENGYSKGLGLIDAEVVKIELGNKNYRIPHMGWNDVKGGDANLFNEIKDGSCFYFVHSYECKIFDKDVNIGYTNYGRDIIASFSKKNVYGVQFHPEKSQIVGLHLLRNFINLC